MTKQRRFTKDFENEAVRLAPRSGRTQREIAEDLGVGLSTLVRAIGRYIDGFYNPVRRHSALGFTSPNRFERLAAD